MRFPHIPSIDLSNEIRMKFGAIARKSMAIAPPKRLRKRLITSKAPRIRMAWDEAFLAMAAHHDDVLLNEVNTTDHQTDKVTAFARAWFRVNFEGECFYPQKTVVLNVPNLSIRHHKLG
jgi:hypothetical protein